MLTSQSYGHNGSVAIAPASSQSAPESGMLCISNPESIKAYFLKIREMAKSGVQYPANLSEAWPLVYSRKGDAVRALTAGEFVEGYDYQLLRSSAKQKRYGHNEINYALSLSCLEFFIARKVKEVFSVYREVFHRAMDFVETSVHLDPRITALIQLTNQQTERIIGLEGRIDRMHKAREKYFNATVCPKRQVLTAEQKRTVESRRYRAMEMVSKYIATHGHYARTWEGIWEDIESNYQIDLQILRNNQQSGEHLLDVAVRFGYMDQAWEVIFSQYGRWS